MIENASLVHEYQLAGVAALEPKTQDKFPEAVAYLAYPESISLWNAVARIRTLQPAERDARTDDPLLLASLMVKNGYRDATPEFVKNNMLALARNWPPENLSAIVSYLKELYERRSGDALLATLQAQIKSGKISFTEAEEIFARKSSEIVGVQQGYITRDPDLVAFARKAAEDRRNLVDRKGLPTLPAHFVKMSADVALELDTLVLITGSTGSGKTILAEMIAEHLMDEGQRVLYVMTELTSRQMVWRRLSRKFGVSYKKLRMGCWEDRFSEELRPRRNGGGIDYFEAGDVMLPDILNEARKSNSHLILDYFDMIGLGTIKALGGLKGLSMNKSELVGYGLTSVKAYAQHEGKLAVVVQQLGKDEDAGPMDSARFKHRANLWLKTHFGVAEEALWRTHPFTAADGTLRALQINKGKIDPQGTLDIGKETFGDSTGNRYPAFLDGQYFRFIDTGYLTLDQVTYGKS